MSLTLSENKGSSIPLLEEGTYPAVCNMLVDLGLQYSERYGKHSRKVLIGWEVIGETVEIDGKEEPRTFSARYTASLNEKSELRKTLKAWRGRDFTLEELKEFNLRNIIGAPCFIQIIHNTAANGNIYANLAAVTRLPKGYEAPTLSTEPVVYDIDESDPEDVNKLPNWIADIIRSSSSYQERVSAASINPQAFAELDDTDGELPF